MIEVFIAQSSEIIKDSFGVSYNLFEQRKITFESVPDGLIYTIKGEFKPIQFHVKEQDVVKLKKEDSEEECFLHDLSYEMLKDGGEFVNGKQIEHRANISIKNSTLSAFFNLDCLPTIIQFLYCIQQVVENTNIKKISIDDAHSDTFRDEFNYKNAATIISYINHICIAWRIFFTGKLATGLCINNTYMCLYNSIHLSSESEMQLEFYNMIGGKYDEVVKYFFKLGNQSSLAKNVDFLINAQNNSRALDLQTMKRGFEIYPGDIIKKRYFYSKLIDEGFFGSEYRIFFGRGYRVYRYKGELANMWDDYKEFFAALCIIILLIGIKWYWMKHKNVEGSNNELQDNYKNIEEADNNESQDKNLEGSNSELQDNYKNIEEADNELQDKNVEGSNNELQDNYKNIEEADNNEF